MQLAPARSLPSTPRSLLPPSPISDTLSSAQQATRTGVGGKGLLAPGVAATAAKPSVAPSPTPAGAAKAPASATTGSDSANALHGAYDLSTDPIVQKIQALNAANYGQAVGAADAARKQALIDSGFGDLAGAAQFGSLEAPTTGDQATALAAAHNPYSTAARLALAHQQADAGIDQGDNNANLFYSSTRANHLGDEAHSYLGNLASAEDQTRQQLSAILQTLLGVRTGGNTDLANGYETARQDAITNAISSGETFVGYDANGNPIFKGAGGGDTAGTSTPTAPYSSAGSQLRAGIGVDGALNTLLPALAAAAAKAKSSSRSTAG